MNARTGFPTKSLTAAAAAETNRTITTPCELDRVQVYNGTGADAYLLVFDSATVPSNNTFAAYGAAPLPPILVPTLSPSQAFSFNGLQMSTGVACCLSTSPTQITLTGASNRFLITYR